MTNRTNSLLFRKFVIICVQTQIQIVHQKWNHKAHCWTMKNASRGTMSHQIETSFFPKEANGIVNQFEIMMPRGTMGREYKHTSWCADRRHRTVWRARRIFFKTYLKWNELVSEWHYWRHRTVSPSASAASPLLLNFVPHQECRAEWTLPNLLQHLILLHFLSRTWFRNHLQSRGGFWGEIACRAEEVFEANCKNSGDGVNCSRNGNAVADVDVLRKFRTASNLPIQSKYIWRED